MKQLRIKPRMWTCRTAGVIFSQTRVAATAQITSASRTSQPMPPESYKSQPYIIKLFLFFLEEGGKRWNSLVYIGIQCYTNTAVKPQFVQWSYELEWMLEYDTRSYSVTASVSPNKIPLSIPAQLVQQQLILQICTRSEQFSLGNLNNGRN